MRRVVAVLLHSCLLPTLLAQQPADPARLDARRITSGEFSPQRFGPARWLDGGHLATLEADAARSALELIRYDAVSGAREVLVPVGKLRVEGRDRPLLMEDYQFSPDHRRLLVFTDSERVWRQNTRGEYYVVDLAGASAPKRLGGALPKSSLMFAKFSPQGDRVAYVSAHDLFVEDLGTGAQTRLTSDGSTTTINGTFDWVYEEEFDCRDGFQWSPDGSRIAYWQLDASGIGVFDMIDNLSDRYPKVVPVQYPLAGTTNSACKVGVVPATGGETVWMKTPGDPRETYIPRMAWHPMGEELMLQWLTRSQQELRIFAATAENGDVREVHSEGDSAYIDVREDFQWLAGGDEFLWTSDADRRLPPLVADEPTHWRVVETRLWDLDAYLERHRREHPEVKLYKAENLTGRLTEGFDVMALSRVLPQEPSDKAAPLRIYLNACDGNPTQQYLFLADGVDCRRITPADQPGWHDYDISPDGSLAIHTYSRFDTPPVIDLIRLSSHERVRVLVDNQPLRERYAAVTKGKNEFFRVKTADGIELDGWAMYPPDFDASKSWPVLFHVYGEPWSQTVKDTWSLGHHLFHRWLTQQGYVVMSIDARGTPAPRGREWRKALYQQIGVLSSHDWDQAVRALCAQHSWMDPQRLAIWGWSGGGAMTLNMLFRYPDLFAAGMSVAPVTDIALYDTIYQERYTGDPRLFPQVYHDCSPIYFAGNLKAKLLLVHGTGDDNVHYQNSERLVNQLIAHDKHFEFLAYPNRTHAIREGAGTRQHLYGSLGDFLNRRVPAGPK